MALKQFDMSEVESENMYSDYYVDRIGDIKYDTDEFKTVGYIYPTILNGTPVEACESELVYKGDNPDGADLTSGSYDDLISANHMFTGNTDIKVAPKFPDTGNLKEMKGTFAGSTVESGIVIPEGVEDIYNICGSCKNLKEVPVIPKSVDEYTDAHRAFSGCSEEILKIAEWNLANRGQSFYTDAPKELRDELLNDVDNNIDNDTSKQTVLATSAVERLKAKIDQTAENARSNDDFETEMFK